MSDTRMLRMVSGRRANAWALMLFAVITMGLFVPMERADAATENRFAGQGVNNPSFEIAWNNVGNILSDNNSDANSEGGFDSDEIHSYLRSRNYGFAIPAGATILGIEVQVEIWDANATLDMDDDNARLVKADVLVGADRSMAAVWPSSRTVRTYGSPTDLWGTTWTPAEVNAAGFGFAHQPNARSGGTNAIARADYQRIIVYFSGLEITKAFGTDPIAPGGVSTLTLTISNSYLIGLTGVAVSDTYPIEITNSTPNNGATTCAGGIVTAVDGGSSVSLSGATMPASSSCTVTVDVTSTTPGGPYFNTTGTVTANEVPPSSTASDSLTVTAGGGNVCSIWSLQASGTTEALRGVHFPVGDAVGYAVGNAGTILKTFDGGTNWAAQVSGTGNTISGIYFPVDASTGWAVGNLGLILKTSNGGATWSPQISGTAENLSGIHFPVDALTGYVVGKTGVIRKTTDGGSNWNALPTATDDLNAVQFPVDATTGYAVGKNGLIIKTTNGGAGWTPQASGTTNTLSGVNFPTGTLTGWITGNSGTVLKTTDGGTNWNPQISGTGVNLDDIQFPTNTSTGYLVGKAGRVMDTKNGGTSWILDASVPTAEDLRAMHFPVNENTGYITGNNGTILKCGTGGIGGPTPEIVKRSFEADGTVIAHLSTVPNYLEFKYLLYINNTGAPKTDVSVRDILDAAFQYQTGTIQVDNTVAECALPVCTPVEELAIFTSVDGAAVLTDTVDGDAASFAGSTLDAGNQYVGNPQLNISADAVWAILFSVKMP